MKISFSTVIGIERLDWSPIGELKYFWLEGPFEDLEISKVKRFICCYGDKSPGPYGFVTTLFEDFWDILMVVCCRSEWSY